MDRLKGCLIVLLFGISSQFALAATDETSIKAKLKQNHWNAYARLAQGNTTADDLCSSDVQCNHGKCELVDSVEFPEGRLECVCDKCYGNEHGKYCNYQKTKKLPAFLISFLVGELGVDWFVLAKGNGGYIGAGVAKLLTGGGLGVWWVVDWVRVLTDSWVDGNGHRLCKDWV